MCGDGVNEWMVWWCDDCDDVWMCWFCFVLCCVGLWVCFCVIVFMDLIVLLMLRCVLLWGCRVVVDEWASGRVKEELIFCLCGCFDYKINVCVDVVDVLCRWMCFMCFIYLGCVVLVARKLTARVTSWRRRRIFV